MRGVIHALFMFALALSGCAQPETLQRGGAGFDAGDAMLTNLKPVGAKWTSALGGSPTICFLGDSITYGVGGTGGADGFRPAVATALTALVTAGTLPNLTLTYVGGTTVGTAPTNHHRGISGSTVLDHITDAATQYGAGNAIHPLLFRIGLGTNDIADATMSANYETNMGTLLTTLHTAEPSSVFVLGRIPPHSNVTRAAAQNLALHSVVLTARAAGMTIVLEDDPGLSAAGGADYNDGTHPNDSGYAKLAAVIAPAIVRAMGF